MNRRVAILGAGPGGYVAAIRAAQLGAEVTVIENDNVGGTCLNWGCIPSKVIITTAELLEKFHRADHFGITLEGSVRVNMPKVMARKQAVVKDQADGILKLFKQHKIHYLKGSGIIKGPGIATVKDPIGSETAMNWDDLIIATGTQPAMISGFSFDGQRLLSSNDALNLEEVPESILIVGGGVIGCEFACMLSALGAAVTLVEALPRLLPLPSIDEACSKVMLREMKKRKIKCLLSRTVIDWEEIDGRLKATIGPSPFLESPSDKDRDPLICIVDKILICIGRRPNSSGIGLESIGVQTDEKGWIVADEQMRTNAANVYAIGDILGPSRVMLAHVASAEGIVAAENVMGLNRKMDYSAVPGAIFTSPEVACVGLSEQQAQQEGYEIRSDSVLFRTIGKSQVIGEIAGEAKIVYDADNGKVLGVHMIGPRATDLIAEATLALRLGATVRDIGETVHAHPTLSEIMLELAHKAEGHPIHG
jgi:dihydrolipoamide dehydrogenase